MRCALVLFLLNFATPLSHPPTFRRRAFLVSSVLQTAALPLVSSAAADAPLSPSPLDATTVGRKQCTTDPSPSRTTVTCYGHILSLPNPLPPDYPVPSLSKISANENGVSTSSVKVPSKFTPPWSYSTSTSDPTKAWSSLVNYVNSMEGCNLIQTMEGDKWSYMHVTFPTSFPVVEVSAGNNAVPEESKDDLEFILRVDDGIILVRSSSRRSIFVYPLQQQVGDKDSNRKRMDAIRNGLNWSELG